MVFHHLSTWVKPYTYFPFFLSQTYCIQVELIVPLPVYFRFLMSAEPFILYKFYNFDFSPAELLPASHRNLNLAFVDSAIFSPTAISRKSIKVFFLWILNRV